MPQPITEYCVCEIFSHWLWDFSHVTKDNRLKTVPNRYLISFHETKWTGRIDDSVMVFVDHHKSLGDEAEILLVYCHEFMNIIETYFRDWYL